jgi:hypothetical protein
LINHQTDITMLRSQHIPPKTTPAWIVCAWPPVTCKAVQAPELHFVHLGTRVLNPGDSDTPTTGQTLWGGPSGDGAAGVAWDWVQIQEGVVAVTAIVGRVWAGPPGLAPVGRESSRDLAPTEP